MRTIFQPAVVLLLTVTLSPAARLTRPAEQAFDSYVRTVEDRLASEKLAAPTGPRVSIEPIHGGSWSVAGGLLHHWRAAALIPGATAQEVLSLLQDYDHLARYYAPEVVSSRSLAVDSEKADIAMRFRKHKIITVVLDAEFQTRSALTTEGKGYSFSRSTHIWQVDQSGSPSEHRRTEGDDDGFLWRLNSYWTFEETRDGLVVACEAVSLTRDIPAGLGWLIAPVVRSLPRTSLEFTLTSTRNALAANAARRNHDDCTK